MNSKLAWATATFAALVVFPCATALAGVGDLATVTAGPSIGPAKLTLKLAAPAIVGHNTLQISVRDDSGKPQPGAKVILSVLMTSMDMGTAHPPVKDLGGGEYSATIDFSMAGPWRVKAVVGSASQVLDVKVGAPMPMGGQGMEGMPNMQMSSMQGRLGPWSMSKEGSGTSWLPESSPMFMKMLPKSGRWDLDLMGFFTLNYSDSGGKRGDSRFYSNSMPMLMGMRGVGGGMLGFSLMGSLDPIFNGEFGYPDLFQTGETAYGIPLVDYQHPHDLISEVTASYSHPIGGGLNAFVYGGPVGEAALGGPTFAHRVSGMEIPEAPITHHWFDSTHISWGVVTLGLNSNTWQIEGSAFNGHEPDENRFSPDPIGLNSASARLTYDPSTDLSFNVSYGYLNSPESKEPGVDQHRLTGAALWNRQLAAGDDLAVTAGFGRNIMVGKNSDALFAEATYYHRKDSFFARWENVDKDELVGVPAGDYTINKLLFGGIKNLTSRDGFDIGLGAYAGVYGFPSTLKPFYGNPVTLGVFLRIRPGKGM